MIYTQFFHIYTITMCNVGSRDNGVGGSKCKALLTNVVKTGRVEHQQTVQSKAEAKKVIQYTGNCQGRQQSTKKTRKQSKDQKHR